MLSTLMSRACVTFAMSFDAESETEYRVPTSEPEA